MVRVQLTYLVVLRPCFGGSHDVHTPVLDTCVSMRTLEYHSPSYIERVWRSSVSHYVYVRRAHHMLPPYGTCVACINGRCVD